MNGNSPIVRLEKHNELQVFDVILWQWFVDHGFQS